MKTIEVAQCLNPKWSPTLPHDARWIYEVNKTINVTDVYIGQRLSKEEVDDYIERGIKVIIK